MRKLTIWTVLAALLGALPLAQPAVATPSQDSVTAASAAVRRTLPLFWHPGRGDNYTSSSHAGNQSAIAAGYSFARFEGWGLETQDPGTVPLYLFWSPGREDNFTTATRAGIDSAYAAGYQYVRVEAYVYSYQASGTVPLYLFWSDSRQDNFTTATQAGIDSAYAAGYRYVRVEGYVYPY